MNRRDVLFSSVAGVAAVALAGNALAQGGAKAAVPAKSTDVRAALLASLADCQRTGDLCLAHCAEELGKGNKSMGRCNKSVQEMLALVRALSTLAAHESKHAKQLATLCATACKECKEACAEHQAHFGHGMHLACKECMDACAECEKACRAYAA